MNPRLEQLIQMGVDKTLVDEGVAILEALYGGADGWSFYTDSNDHPMPFIMENDDLGRSIELQ